MAKEKKYGIMFDSGWEVQYWEKLKEENKKFIYHPNLLKVNNINYEPDFLEYEEGVVTLIEIKSGYNPYSQHKDAMLHSSLKTLAKYEQEYLCEYASKEFGLNVKEVKYKKIKYLVKYGFVDFSFKPRGLKDQWKDKALAYEQENKLLKKEIRDYKRYLSYLEKDKLTKKQREWFDKFKDNIKE